MQQLILRKHSARPRRRKGKSRGVNLSKCHLGELPGSVSVILNEASGSHTPLPIVAGFLITYPAASTIVYIRWLWYILYLSQNTYFPSFPFISSGCSPSNDAHVPTVYKQAVTHVCCIGPSQVYPMEISKHASAIHMATYLSSVPLYRVY